MKNIVFYKKLINLYKTKIKYDVRRLAIEIYMILLNNQNISKDDLIDKLLVNNFSLRLLDVGVFYYLVDRMYTDFRKLPKSVTPDNVSDFFLFYSHTAPLTAFGSITNHSNIVHHTNYIHTHNLYQFAFSKNYVIDPIQMHVYIKNNSLDAKSIFAFGNLLSMTIELNADEDFTLSALEKIIKNINKVNKLVKEFPYTTDIFDYYNDNEIFFSKIAQLFIMFTKTSIDVKVSYNNTYEIIHPFDIYSFFNRLMELLIENKKIKITFMFNEDDEILFGVKKIYTSKQRKFYPVIVYTHYKNNDRRYFIKVDFEDVVCNYSFKTDIFKIQDDIAVIEGVKYAKEKHPLLKYIYMFSYDDIISDYTSGLLITAPTILNTYKLFKKEYKKLFKQYINKNALFSYQFRDIQYLLSKDRLMYFADTGIGKTRVALSVLLLLAKKYNKPTFYILPTGQDTSLAEDIEALGIEKYVKFLYKSKYKYNKKYYKHKYIKEEYLLNLEPGIVYIVKDRDIVKNNFKKIDYDIVLVDEYDKYKNTYSNLSKIINDILMNASIFYTMSGTLHPSKLNNSSKYYNPFFFEHFIGYGTPFMAHILSIYISENVYTSTFKEYNISKYSHNSIFNFLMRDKLHPAMKTTIMSQMVRTSKDDPYVNIEYKYKKINFHYYNLYMTNDEFNQYKININYIMDKKNYSVLDLYKLLNKLSIYITLGFSKDLVRNKKLWTLKMLLKNISNKNEKAIVLFENDNMLELFKEQFAKIYDKDKILIFSGKTNMKKRMDTLLKFKENADIIAMFATIRNIARSYNLPEANHVIFVEADMSSVKNVQAFNRICRPQQDKEDINVYFINFKYTLDEYKFNKIVDLVKNNASFNFSDANYIKRISNLTSISELLGHLKNIIEDYKVDYDNYELKIIEYN